MTQLSKSVCVQYQKYKILQLHQSTSELAVDFIQEKKRQSLRLLTLVQPALKARRRLKTSAQDLTKCSMIIAKVQVISRPHFRSRL